MRISIKKISPLYLLIYVSVLNLAGYILISCNRSKQTEPLSSNSYHKEVVNHFVGDRVCKNCHAKEYNEWKQSDHFHSMEKATDQTVRGDFRNVSFKSDGITWRFYKKDGKFMVHTVGQDDKYHDFTISYTFGWHPLQQYLVRFPRGKYQALTVAWDTQKKRWFSLYPNQKINPESVRDWLFWTNGAMNWNVMCADCHSTNLRQNYIAQSDSFHTTWSVMNVSCESCHGPGEKHVKYTEALDGKKPNMAIIRRDLEMTRGIASRRLVDECARCHSLREQITNSYNYKENFFDSYSPQLPHPDNYYGDGQMKSEDYVYGSFLQSKMYHYGIACTNCHDPHTMHLKLTGNQLCTGCHDQKKYDNPTHYHHKLNTKAALCINCHMPGKNYMKVDFRRDHSFRLPRPDLTEKYGVPNACNNCHQDKSAKWAATAIYRWYGKRKTDFFDYTGILARASKEEASKVEPQLIEIVTDRSVPAIARATAIWYLGQTLNESSLPVIQQSLNAQSPLVRLSAVKALAQLPAERKREILSSSLNDSVRAVRVAAATDLAEFSANDFRGDERRAFMNASNDLHEDFDVTQYFPAGQMNMGEYYEKKGEWTKAIEAYKKALKKDPHFNAARMNLAFVLNKHGKDQEAERLLITVTREEPQYGPAYYSLALLQSEEKRLNEAIPNFKKAAQLMPDNSRVRYNLAIALQTLKRPGKAEAAYLNAINLAPDNPDYQYGICTLYLQQGQYKKALPHVEKLEQLQPYSQRVQNLANFIRSHIH